MTFFHISPLFFPLCIISKVHIIDIIAPFLYNKLGFAQRRLPPIELLHGFLQESHSIGI